MKKLKTLADLKNGVYYNAQEDRIIYLYEVDKYEKMVSFLFMTQEGDVNLIIDPAKDKVSKGVIYLGDL